MNYQPSSSMVLSGDSMERKDDSGNICNRGKRRKTGRNEMVSSKICCDFRICAVITALAFLLLAGGALAVPYEAWTNTFGGKANDGASYVSQTKDGGYIIAGYTGSYGNNAGDLWLIRTDVKGIEQWNRTFGGKDRDEARFVQQTSDGGYIIAGFTDSFGIGGSDAWQTCLISSVSNACSDAWIVKTDGNGIEQWNRTFGEKSFGTAYSVLEAKDGGYVIAGNTDAYGAGFIDVWFIKTDANGIEQWNRTFGGKNSDEASDVLKTKDGGYIITGTTDSFGSVSLDAWLIKTDANGIEQWNRTFGGIDQEFAYSVQEINNGGYIIAGTVRSYEAGSAYALIIRTNENGKELWNKTYRGQGTAVARSIRQTPDGGYIAAGETCETGSHCENPDAWLIKTDANGVEQWSRVFGGIRYDTANSVQLTRDGGYIFAGTRTDSYGDGYVNAWLVKVNEGAKDMEKNIPFPERSSPAPDIAKNIAIKNLDKEILKRTPEVVNTSWITDKSALVILTFKDPDSPAQTIVGVDLNKKEIDSVEKISWNLNFPLYFNITSNPSGADVYLTKYSPELCGPLPHKPGSDHIGKTPLTYKFEYNETFLPLSGLFSLFHFSSSGYEEESECINIYGSESSEISVSMVEKGYFEPVPRTNQTYYLVAKLKPLETIKVEKVKKEAGFEIFLAVTALSMAITIRRKRR